MAANKRMLTVKAVAGMFAVHNMTVRKWLSSGKMPAPIRLCGRAIRWWEDDILKWVAAGGPVEDF
jgi:excisionase family DNA binding protein